MSSEVLSQLQVLSMVEDKNIMILDRLFNRLLDKDNLVLSEKCCKRLSMSLRLDSELLKRIVEANKGLSNFFEDVAENQRVSYDEVLSDTDSEEYKTGLILTKLFSELFEDLFCTLRPTSAELETLVEDLLPMTELKGNNPAMVLSSLDDDVYEKVLSDVMQNSRSFDESTDHEPSGELAEKLEKPRTLTRRQKFSKKNRTSTKAKEAEAEFGNASSDSDGDFYYNSIDRVRKESSNKSPRDDLNVNVVSGDDLFSGGRERVVKSTMTRVQASFRKMRATLGAVDMKAALFATSNMESVVKYVKKRTRIFYCCECFIDNYLACAAASAAWKVLAEMLHADGIYASASRRISKVLGHLIRTGLPLFERSLAF